MLDEAAAIYPRVARGETSGERALFQRAALWTAYFNNRKLSIFGGSNEIQHNILAKAILGL